MTAQTNLVSEFKMGGSRPGDGGWVSTSATTVPVRRAVGNATAVECSTFQKAFARRIERIIGVAAAEGAHVTSETRELAQIVGSCIEHFDAGAALPNVALGTDDDLLLEWWCGPRKLSIYVGDQGAQFVQVWGTDVENEMADGYIEDEGEVVSLYQWLRGI